MKINSLGNKIYHVTFDTTQKLARAFMPLQEYYENKRFADSEFSRKEFGEWYAKKYGSKYENDWTGFNIPLYMIPKFFSSKKLMGLVNGDVYSRNLFRAVAQKLTPDCYLIGTAEGCDPATLKHELAHARFYTDALYRLSVESILVPDGTAGSPFLRELLLHLNEISYHPKVLIDEAHAYILTEEEYLRDKGLWRPEFDGLRATLEKL